MTLEEIRKIVLYKAACRERKLLKKGESLVITYLPDWTPIIYRDAQFRPVRDLP